MKKQKAGFVRGSGTNRRTEASYMGVLLDTVTLDDWRDVVGGAVQAAKDGDAQARAWLAQYLMGRAAQKAPAPLTVQVNQWSGTDPLAERLAQSTIHRQEFPSLHRNDDWKREVQEAVEAEVAQKLPSPESVSNPAPARVSADSAGVVPLKVAK
jgi:hypothetical protein